ncbi:hypothetical protein [Variovorax rhizosphaerae]|uniref:Peptidoglycan-binding protein n=1 Tax=Variovorax rhizosphaerae TaxID=1836200 RepID=A0ABU8WQ70_9BURK
MFDLFKDIDKYKGIPPYASEHYGVYQPLLGWQSRLTKSWVQNGGVLIDPQVKRILDRRLTPGPVEVQQNDPREFMAHPLDSATGKSPYTVVLLKNLASEVLKIVRGRVQGFVDASKGILPNGAQWNSVIEVNELMEPKQGTLRLANDRIRARLFDEAKAQAPGGLVTAEMAEALKARHLVLMQYESQIATFLLSYAEGQGGTDPNELQKLFAVSEAPPLADILRSTDPLANIDPNDRSGVLSPVGFVHLFRQYFFDLGTFLGEPVEHIWLAPGTTIELVEVSTRKTIIERTEESSSESTSRMESSSDVKDELSDAVKSENGSSTKLGVSTTNSVNFGVYQGTATVTLGLESTRKDARETSHKQNREQAEKLSTEIKRSFKSVFKSVTETGDMRSRRYVLQNTGPDLINYELRRKMRRVGVQMQGLGERLCSQVFVDDAGSALGLSELVHFAASPDLSSLKRDDVPLPVAITKTVTARIPFQGRGTNDDSGPGADYGATQFLANEGKYTGHRTNTNDENAEDAEVVMGPFSFKFDPPQAGYELLDVRPVGPQGNKRATARPAQNKKPDGSFELVMDAINFGGENQVLFDVELSFGPVTPAMEAYAALKKEADKKYDADKQRLLEKSFLENVRQRIKDASNIAARPAWDLREEERTVVYRKLVERLMLDSWGIATKKPGDGSNTRLAHVRSEVIRAIFDVDGMLYFVAPEWWMPRRHKSQYDGRADFHLTEQDLVQWDDLEKRDDNYRITEDSTTAKFGSSLGWLLQLDGDNLRNAFLNAPWVKAVIPIRPGRERAALNWLRAIEGHEFDGWDAPYTAITPEDTQLLAELAADGLPATIGNVLEKIAARMERENADIHHVLEADRVFEHGFDHLAGGFDASVDPTKPFSQWVSVLPTDQIVAVPYQATDFLVP